MDDKNDTLHELIDAVDVRREVGPTGDDVCVFFSGLRLRMGYTVMHEIPISSPPILMTSLPHPRTQ
jgi:hypothetical protein